MTGVGEIFAGSCRRVTGTEERYDAQQREQGEG
jgi:hypothetical protein